MYAFISGKVDSVGTNFVVLDNNGIGYQIFVSGNSLYDVPGIGSAMKIYTYLYVREDEMTLYGFSRLEEKTLFERLIDISGIGPKGAMQILSGYDLKTLLVAIATSDIKTLSKIKGLGKKTAELICLNLREQVADDMTAMDGGANVLGDDMSDAVFALASLGLSQTDAVKAVQDAAKAVSGIENIIAYALKNYK